jgi:transcription initiation factor IIE alpha subunit
MKTTEGKPFDPADNYVKLHRALFTLYTRLPDFKPQHVVMYAYLCDKYNAKAGYAYPTQTQIAEDLGIGVNAPGVIAKVLRKYGLIEYKRRNDGSTASNYVYYVKSPITDQAEFWRKFGVESAEEPAETVSESERIQAWL